VQHCPWSFRTVGKATSEKGMPLRCEEISVLFLMRLSRLEQHHKNLSSVCGTVHGVTVVLGKDGQWMEMGIVDALPLGEL
jgi:hypothetical protein